MRDMPDTLRAAIAREDLSFVHLFELTLKDTTVYRYTDNTNAINYDGHIWRADASIDISAIRDTQDALSQTATVQVGYVVGALTEEVARKGGLDGAKHRVLLIDYRRPELGAVVIFAGYVDRLTASTPYTCSIDLTSFQGKSVAVTGVYSLKCRNVFCDAGCKLNIADYSYDFTVQGPKGTPTSGALGIDANVPDGIAAYGSVLWTSGKNKGELSLVADNEGGQVVLAIDPPYTPLAGDKGTLRAGCDFYAQTCLTKYNNLKNMQAEPAVPQGTETSGGKGGTTSTTDPAKPVQRPDPVYETGLGFPNEIAR